MEAELRSRGRPTGARRNRHDTRTAAAPPSRNQCWTNTSCLKGAESTGALRVLTRSRSVLGCRPLRMFGPVRWVHSAVPPGARGQEREEPTSPRRQPDRRQCPGRGDQIARPRRGCTPRGQRVLRLPHPVTAELGRERAPRGPHRGRRILCWGRPSQALLSPAGRHEPRKGPLGSRLTQRARSRRSTAWPRAGAPMCRH